MLGFPADVNGVAHFVACLACHSTKAQSSFACPIFPQHLHASVMLGGVLLERHIFAICPGLLHVWHIDPSVRL